MVKTSLVFLFLLLSFLAVRAQPGNKFSISAGIQLAVPMETRYGYDDSQGHYFVGMGFTAAALLPVSSKLDVAFNTGYLLYAPPSKMTAPGCYNCTVPPNTEEANGEAYKFVPVEPGIRYYYFRGLYADAEAGISIKDRFYVFNSFLYSFGLGGSITFDKHNALDIALHYDDGFRTTDFDHRMGQISLGIAYRYTF